MKRAVEAHAGGCLYVEVLNGDSVWIVDSDPNVVLKSANRIREELFEAPGHPELRMAADYGPVQFRRETREETRLAGGEAILRVARIEPRVVPSEIWATREFKEQLERRPSLYSLAPIRPEADEGGGPRHFNVRKPESDGEDLLVELFRVGLRA